ncbi:MAG: hypothetical protein WCB94_17670 [Terriglobales bacterium]
MKRQSLTIALIILGICTLGVISAAAQDVFKVNYFSNNWVAGAPDGTVRVTNPGTSNGNLCAMVYVFDNDQQMSECCGCITTPDGLRTFSVKTNLTSNPLTGVYSNNGDIKIVAAAVNNSPCDATANVTPTPTLRAWGTHIQNKVGTAYPITETDFSDATLSAGELSSLQADCYFVNRLGSGRGICSCGSGD